MIIITDFYGCSSFPEMEGEVLKIDLCTPHPTRAPVSTRRAGWRLVARLKVQHPARLLCPLTPGKTTHSRGQSRQSLDRLRSHQHEAECYPPGAHRSNGRHAALSSELFPICTAAKLTLLFLKGCSQDQTCSDAQSMPGTWHSRKGTHSQTLEWSAWAPDLLMATLGISWVL